MIDLSQELEKLSHYYDSEMIIDKYTMDPVFKFKHKSTKKEYSYRLSMIDIKLLNKNTFSRYRKRSFGFKM
jgi:hypothetical protein